MLLGGYSRCALGDLTHSLDVRPKTAESGLEPEDCVGILVLQLERALCKARTSIESELQGPTRVCQAPQIDTTSCPCHADNISISGWRPETPL